MNLVTTRAVALALACVLVSPLSAQNPPAPSSSVQIAPTQNPTPVPAPGEKPYSGPLPDSGGRIPAVDYGIGYIGDYKPGSVSAFDPANSPRIHDLIRAGIIYLSLQDAIALALENNLDLQWQRYTVKIAATDTLRARGGGLLRGIQLVANEPPAGLGGPGEPLLNSAATGSTPQSSIQANVSDTAFIVESQDNLNTTGPIAYALGPAIPQFDPSLNAQFLAQHATTPENSTVITGTPALVSNTVSENAGYTQGFSPGTTVTAGWQNLRTDANSVRNLLNPYYNSTLGVTVTQPLLRGFGIELNRRFIRIGKLTEELSDHVFRYQASITVGGVIRLYTDLVSLSEDLKVKEETLNTAQRLAEDNRNKVDQGTLAPVELTLRQTQVRTKQLENSVRVQVEDALIALQRTKSAYEAASETRKLQEQSLEIEQERFNVGLSTNFLVIQYQSYVAQARSSEVAALGAYAKARTQLDSAMGIILRANGVTLPVALQGSVARTSTPAVK